MSLFSETNAQILPLLRQDNSALKSGLLHKALHTVRARLMQSYCVDTFVAYERYLEIFSIRLGDRSIQDEFTLLGWDFFEREFQKDPSRSDIVVGLAFAKIKTRNVGRGRHLLRRIAASGFRERDLARQLLGRFV
jgi:hypothetical protein